MILSKNTTLKKKSLLHVDVLKREDEFISNKGRMPEGFCSWAWVDIHRDVTVLTLGGNSARAKIDPDLTCLNRLNEA